MGNGKDLKLIFGLFSVSVLLIAVAGYIFGAPILDLASKVALYSLCEDLVENPNSLKSLYFKEYTI